VSDVTPLKENVQVEQIEAGAAASESVMQIMAGSNNFWNTYYEGSRGWFLNGPYSTVPGIQTGVDGAIFCPSDMEIYCIGMYNLVAGSVGDIEFDVIRHKTDNTSATIFTTRPKIPFTSGNDARLVKRFSDNTTLYQSAGSTLPVLVSANLNAGDMLTCNVTLKQTSGQSAGIVLFLRPR
jgi:hypothetical protein